jgi:hypothetical protein
LSWRTWLMWCTWVWLGEEGSTPKAAICTRGMYRLLSRIWIRTHPPSLRAGSNTRPSEFLTRPWLETQVWFPSTSQPGTGIQISPSRSSASGSGLYCRMLRCTCPGNLPALRTLRRFGGGWPSALRERTGGIASFCGAKRRQDKTKLASAGGCWPQDRARRVLKPGSVSVNLA